MLQDIIPVDRRRQVYTVYVYAVAVHGTVFAAFSAVQAPLPTWHTVTGAVLTYIGGLLGLVAAKNAVTPKVPDGT